ncbi:hypothetical protein BDV24DRAFT_170146 [Aspergillus arachidicola]|uniref:Ubiquitin-like protease family profile domain-containing protein n=1 Tax=Aspergillus arachidicola TaxID=656916 RepID=A0A5N6XNF8_9EURO|nr:hypothetical protein BDV24DRAFT_170146 [Aspergillus arachidicola]
MQEREKFNEPRKVQERLVIYLRQCVDILTSDVDIDLNHTPEFYTTVQQLCEKAPEAAQMIARTIQENITNSRGRKRKRTKDPSYHPRKGTNRATPPASVSGDESNLDENLGASSDFRGGPLTSSSQRDDGNNKKDRDAPMTDADAPTDAPTTLGSEGLAASSKMHSQHKEPLPHVLPEPVLCKELLSTQQIPITPTKLINSNPPSPQTEDICRGKIATSLESTSSIGRPTPTIIFPATRSIIDLTTEAAYTIYRLSKHQDGLPSDIHKQILKSLQQEQPGASAVSTSNDWSDGAMWIQVLEMGTSQSRRVTIKNMLEYMGAWQWYNSQVELALKTAKTKNNQPVKSHGARSHVMDVIENRYLTGVGVVSLHENEPDSLFKGRPAGTCATDKKRQHIKMQLNRGKICIRLVEDLGVGILLDQKIWKYVKLGKDQLNTLVKDIQTDTRHMKLLQILEPQLEQLVQNGLTDLHRFYNDLNKAELLPQDTLRELPMSFALDEDPLPEGQLNAAIEYLIHNIKTKVLHQETFINDAVTINNGSGISCDIFNQLRPGKWLNQWTIYALMQLCDKPVYVDYNLSIALDERTENQLQPIKQPLRKWANKIATLREKASLVFFCPINHQANHFSLLEVNDRERAIRHYDSLSNSKTIKRMSKLVEEQFGDLRFSFEEMSTPRQMDGWSCGIRTVWNFRRLSNNLLIGTHGTVQKNPERIEGGAMTKYIRQRRQGPVT